MTDLGQAAAYVRAVPRVDESAESRRLERDRLLILDLIERHPGAATRTGRPGHLTGSALVVDDAATSCILLLHRKLGRWMQPGGHADGDTDLARVALREASEETGIVGLLIDPVPVDLDIHLVEPPDDEAHLHLDVRFLLSAPVGSLPERNHESDDVRWVPFDDLERYDPDASLRRLVDAARRRLGSGS